MAVRDLAVVKAQMVIRRPVERVFEAFVDPAFTTRFWFTKSSGRLVPGADLRWGWEMYGVSAQVSVKAFEPNRRVLIEWGEQPCPVEWVSSPRDDATTFVTISSWGFHGSDDEVVRQAIDPMGGFSLVPAGLKAPLEHDVELNLVADHHPDAWIALSRSNGS